MSRRLLPLVALAGMLVLPTAAGARTKLVFAGGPAKWSAGLERKYGAEVNDFLITKVTINAGDSVKWQIAGFHNIDLPKLGGSDQTLLTSTGHTVSGANDAAGNPFWFNGKVPALALNPSAAFPSGGTVYNGSARVVSGLPLGPAGPFTVRFTTPGTYKYYCDVHPGMIGTVVVKAKGAKIPSAKQDAATLGAEQRRYAREARAVARLKVKKNLISLGAARSDGVEVLAMFPRRLQVKRGTKVTFMMATGSRETHSATFGPVKYLSVLTDSLQSPSPAAAAIYPSDPPGHVVFTPTSHGNGFASTGLLDRDPETPLPSSGAIRFTKPGRYRFICIIHPFMVGTIVVK